MQFATHRYLRLGTMSLVMSAAIAADAYAGTDSTFSAIVTKLTAWATGSLGKVIALAMFLIGVGMSVMRQSIAPVAVALAAALALFYGPTIITGVLTGTASAPSRAAHHISAG
jgi:conjugal transfer pilus assembly protein TraA